MGKGNKTKKTEKAKASKKRSAAPKKEILFSKDNYMIIGVGLVLVILGLFLMSGGNNAPDEWDVNEIYSFRRITIAPIVILTGLGVVILAIFKSSDSDTTTSFTPQMDSEGEEA